MSVLRIKNDAGEWTEIVSLQGPKGEDGTMSFEDLTPAQKASLKGDKGDKGERGDIGPQGEEGPQGPIGLTGLQGPRGLPAYISVVQNEGYVSLIATDGDGNTSTATLYNGSKGEIGPQGERGLTGPQGEPGPKGDPGVEGPRGPKGDAPVKGVDYWTEAEQRLMIQEVLESMPYTEGVKY